MPHARPSRWLAVSPRGLINAAIDLAALGLALFVLLRLYTITTAAPVPFDPYLVRADGSRADPVNIVFESVTPGLDSATVADAVIATLGWYDVAGEPMSFVSLDRKQASARQLGRDLGGGTRLHLRIAAVDAADNQTRVLAAVHRDESAACGHVGRGFDETREQLAEAFRAAGYLVTLLSLGNDASGRHCDGSRTSGDGRAVVVRIGGLQ